MQNVAGIAVNYEMKSSQDTIEQPPVSRLEAADRGLNVCEWDVQESEYGVSEVDVALE